MEESPLEHDDASDSIHLPDKQRSGHEGSGDNNASDAEQENGPEDGGVVLHSEGIPAQLTRVDRWAIHIPHLLVSTNATLEKFHVYKWQEIARLAKLIAAPCFRRVRLAGDDRALYECFYRSFPHDLVSKARFVGVTRAALGVEGDLGFKSTLPSEHLALGRHLEKMQYAYELSPDNVLMLNWRLLLVGLHLFQYPLQSLREHLAWGFQVFHSTGFLDPLSDATSAKISDVAAMLTQLMRNQAATRLVAERFRQAQVLEHSGDLTPANVRHKLTSSRVSHRRFVGLLCLPPTAPLFARASEYTVAIEELASPIYTQHATAHRKRASDRKKIERLRYYHRTRRLRAAFAMWGANARIRQRTRRLMLRCFHRIARERRRHGFHRLKRHAIESWAATEIQRLVRGLLGRRRSLHQWQRVQAAIKVQGAFRMRSHFVQFMKELRRRHRAAVMLQRVYRGRVGRVLARQALLALYYRELAALQREREAFFMQVRGVMAQRLQRLFRSIRERKRAQRAKKEAEERRKAEQAMMVQASEAERAIRQYKKEVTAKFDAMREADRYRRQRKQIDGVEKSKVLRLRRQRQWGAFKAERVGNRERYKREAAGAYNALKAEWMATIAERCARKRRFLSQVLDLEEPGEWKALQRQLRSQIAAKEKALRAKYKEANVVAPKQEVAERATVETLDEEEEKERRTVEGEWLQAEAAFLNEMDAKDEAKRLQENADERERREKSAVRMQAAVRMFLARQQLRSLIRERFVKEFEPTTQLAMYRDTYTQQRSARKPFGLGSEDMEYADRWELIPDAVVGQPFFFNPRRIEQSWEQPRECECCGECQASGGSLAFAAYWHAQENEYLCSSCYGRRVEAEPAESELFFAYDGAVRRGGFEA